MRTFRRYNFSSGGWTLPVISNRPRLLWRNCRWWVSFISLLAKCWWMWLVAGLVFSALSLLVQNDTVSTIIGGFAFSCLWGIGEMFAQEKRVLRGWFPENPTRHDYYEKRRKEMQGKL